MLPTTAEPNVKDNDYGMFRTLSFDKKSCDRIKAMSDEDFEKSKRQFPQMAFMLDHIRGRE